jgi:hypothetical protein
MPSKVREMLFQIRQDKPLPRAVILSCSDIGASITSPEDAFIRRHPAGSPAASPRRIFASRAEWQRRHADLAEPFEQSIQPKATEPLYKSNVGYCVERLGETAPKREITRLPMRIVKWLIRQ